MQLERDTKNLIDAIRLLKDAQLQGAQLTEVWLYFRHAETHLQKQFSALMREAEEAA